MELSKERQLLQTDMLFKLKLTLMELVFIRDVNTMKELVDQTTFILPLLMDNTIEIKLQEFIIKK